MDESATSTTCACSHVATWDASAVREGVLLRCPLCGCDDLYMQKDFPERLGLLIVGSGIVAASIAWANYWWVGAFGSLFISGVIDWILFHTRKDVTVCYRCLGQFRNMATNESHRAFDLGIGERYRQERLRKQQLREAGQAPIQVPSPRGSNGGA